MADNPVSHKNEMAKGLIIGSDFLPKLGIRYSMKSKNLSSFLN